MAIINLKNWNLEKHTYVSAPLPPQLYKQYRQFLIRSMIQADYDDVGRVIKIQTNPITTIGYINRDKLLKLKLID